MNVQVFDHEAVRVGQVVHPPAVVLLLRVEVRVVRLVLVVEQLQFVQTLGERLRNAARSPELRCQAVVVADAHHRRFVRTAERDLPRALADALVVGRKQTGAVAAAVIGTVVRDVHLAIRTVRVDRRRTGVRSART